MKTIKLTRDYEVMVDDEDYEYLSQQKWYISRGYAVGNGWKKMHRLILKANDGEIVDHIDRNKLNNTKSNLRIVNSTENAHNQEKRIGTLNTYKGVYYVRKKKVWQSRCRIYGNDFFLGYYKSEIAAAYAYNKKAKELSEYALLNDFNLPIEILEEKLIADLVSIIPAEKQSQHKGIYWHKGKEKWVVCIVINTKRKTLGSFKNEIDAINKLNDVKQQHKLLKR
jgi:hypothetical protein